MSDVSDTPPPLVALTPAELRQASAGTLSHYNDGAQSFWQGTRDHDVSQNVSALLRHLPESGRHTILDLGCGPGRDLVTFRDLGHEAVGLDGAERFVQMARQNSGCEVLHQDFLMMDLPRERFDGIFANAVLFHVPSQELPRVLRELSDSLKKDGLNSMSRSNTCFSERCTCHRPCKNEEGTIWLRNVMSCGVGGRRVRV